MIDNIIKRLYVKRFGEVVTKESYKKLEEKVADLRITITDLTNTHKRDLQKIKNEHKDEINSLNCIIDDLKKQQTAQLEPKTEVAEEKVVKEPKRNSRTRKQAKKLEDKK